MSELINKLVQKLSQEQDVQFFLNDPVENIEFEIYPSNKVKIKSKNMIQDVDLVISSIFSKSNIFQNII
jgi:hypothetical protein